MKKALITATVQSHICQFHKPLAELLHENGYEVEVAARNNLAEKNGMKLDFADRVYDLPFQRSPFSLKNIGAYRQLRRIVNDGDYEVVHCNTPVAGVLTRLAARNKRRQGTKVIYTAHGFHFYKGAPLSAWLIWYPIEKVMARMCDIIITINKEDNEFADKHFRTKVMYTHGVGVDEKRFHSVTPEQRHEMRKILGLSDGDFMVLNIGELLPNKNQKSLIRVADILKDNISELKIFIAGNGPEEKELKSQIQEYDLENIVRLLGYRTDLERIIPAADVVVSCSYREGMPLNIIESMLSGTAVVASHNRGHDELIEDGTNGYLFVPDDVYGMAEKISALWKNEQTRKAFAMEGLDKGNMFSKTMVKNELKSVYKDILK